MSTGSGKKRFMNTKERFMNTMKFECSDRVPNMETGVWKQTNVRWEKEGLPKGTIEDGFDLNKGNDYFDIEGVKILDIDTWNPYPRFEEKVIEEDKVYVTYVDVVGRVRKASKVGAVEGMRASMDMYLDFPVKDRKSFLKHKRYFEGNHDKRYPANWDELKTKVKEIDKPLILMDPTEEHFGYYSLLRSWMGTIGLSYAFYDQSKLVYEACEFITEWIINVLTKAVREVREFDLTVIHEDLGYKTASLISPDLFKKFFLPGYKRVVEFLKSNGVNIILVDSDGNFESLIPLFLEAGIDGFLPLEVAAGMDPVRLRKKYGRSFCMRGGVDKREIAKGKKEIENELKRIIPVVKQGGYIPTIDHRVPPDISLKNFEYYLELKRRSLA